MAIRSMTGYGTGQRSSGRVKVTVELSSVNHKQFDLRLVLPTMPAFVESSIVEQIHKRIARGFVTCRVKISSSSTRSMPEVVVDEALARAYVTRLRAMAGRLGLKDDLSLSVVSAIAGVARSRDPGDDVDTVLPLLLKSLKRALAALVAMRVGEGKVLRRDIYDRTTILRNLVDQIAVRAPAVSEKHRKALRSRILSAGIGLNSDDPRLAREVALFADRSDISEEITRLRSHMKQTVKTLAAAGPVGRTLDFLVQEMFREINTIGSKANDKDIVAEVIRFKSELERIREQVQNVE